MASFEGLRWQVDAMSPVEGAAKVAFLAFLEEFEQRRLQFEAAEDPEGAYQGYLATARLVAEAVDQVDLQGKADIGKAQIQVIRIHQRATRYAIESSRRPDAFEDFLDKTPEDPWGFPLRLEAKDRLDVVIISSGPDADFGTDDDIRSDG